MRNKIMVSILIVLMVLTLTHITLNFAPTVSAEPAPREAWKVLKIDNNKANNITVDVVITLNSKDGVYMASSNDITTYFEDETGWQGLGYADYMDWLNGTSTLPYHWGEMDWRVSYGSLAAISYDDIQHWGDLYYDSGGGVTYRTFMGNTYMADWNFTHGADHDDPDIIRSKDPKDLGGIEARWQAGNKITMVSDLFIGVGKSVWIVFKIVLTEAGAFNFDLEDPSNEGVLSESRWLIGGVDTFLVPYDRSTIQSAIDDSSAGGTIIVYNETVYNGIYMEDLNIPATKANLDIKSFAGASKTKIKGVQNVFENDWPLAMPNIAVNANGVKLHGFTIESPDYVADYYSSGLIIGAPNVEIFDNIFKVLAGTEINETSQGIQTWHRDAVPSVDISGLSIRNNIFTNLNDGDAGYEAVYLNLDTGIGAATISDNTFSGKLVRAITTERSNVAINNNNIITDLTPGIDPGGYQGINIGGVNSGNLTNVSVAGNTIKGSGIACGFSYGIKVGFADTSSLTAISITTNTIQMNDVGIRVRYSASGVRIKWNNFANNTNYAVNNENTTQTLDASYNWWNNKTGPNHASSQYPASLGDSVSDYVLYEPWLMNPYPPLTPVTVVYVSPENTTLETPSWGQQFTANVIITNVSKMWGFQFDLKWNGSLLNLTNPESAVKIPSVWREGTNCYTHTPSYSEGEFTGAFVQAYGSAPPISTTTTLGSFTFRSIYDPIYPLNASCAITLENVIIVDNNMLELTRLVYNGTYNCTSAKAKLLFDKEQYSAQKVPTEFDAYVNARNARDLTSFTFEVEFNSTLLYPILVEVTYPDSDWNKTADTVIVAVSGIDPAINGSAVLARIRFKVYGQVWNSETQPINCTLHFTIYKFNNVDVEEVINALFVYTPLIGDLNMDGYVNIVDLAAAARAFGTKGPPLVEPPETGWLQVADLNCDGIINILDLVVIAYHFGTEAP